ncbi:glycosyltransferase family 28 protein [Calothrix brevissima NIES-22]|nr:glycosyltransferase family 28 protein [Calothrix brevissima NIES-22]
MNLIIRTDASIEIGTGHLMRCLALAQVCQNAGYQPIFMMANAVPVLEQRLLSERMKIIRLSASIGTVEDAQETANRAKELNANWIVLDGYNFGEQYQQVIKSYGIRLLFIDDYGHANYYYADLILNHNIYANEAMYPNRDVDTELLLGTGYTLLRSEFLQWKGWERSLCSKANKILVTLGGSDADNVTLKVIQALQLVAIDELEAIVVVGGSNPHYEQLRLASQNSQFPIRLEKNVTNMPELMAWADVAITAGGSTCWELAFMGLPSVILILAENQRAIAQKLDQMKVSINLGWHEDVSISEIALAISDLLIATHIRVEMNQLGQKLIDGQGSKHVFQHLETKMLKLRLACSEDCQLLWEWSNDPEVRAFSFSTKPIPWEDHVEWFQSRLHSSNTILYIGVAKNDLPVGQIRYDINGDEAIISISIDKKFRHQGYGYKLIHLGCKKIFSNSHISLIHAYIKNDNQASIKVFSKAGFKKIGITKIREYPAFDLVLSRDNFIGD